MINWVKYYIVALAALFPLIGLSYNSEIHAGLEIYDNGSSSASGYIFGANYFFTPIKPNDAPYAEAAFLHRTHSLYGRFHYQSEERRSDTIDHSNFIIGSIYNHQQFTIHGGLRYFSDSNRNSLVAYMLGGVYLEPDFRIQLGFSHFSSDDPSFVSDLRFLAQAKKMMQYKGRQVSLEGKFVFDGDAQSDSSFSFFADYYIDKSLSAGVFIKKNDDGLVSSESALGLRSSWYFTPLMSLEISYHGVGNNFDRLFIGAKGRFN